MRLSTVICNYNTRAELARCLDSLARTSRDVSCEIIVVDNGSHDGSADMVREQFPDVTLIDAGANLWYSGGNNRGIQAARGEYVLLLNPDTVIVEPLGRIVDYLDAHPGVGAVTAQERFADGRVQFTASRLAGYADFVLSYTLIGAVLRGWRERRRRRMWYDGWARDATRPIEVAPGSFLMARRDILARIGGFDERLKLFFTDDDLCRRILGTGAAIHYVADYWLIHDEHASIDQVPRLTQRIYFEDLLAYTRKYHGRAAAWMLAALLVPTRIGMALKRTVRT
jgi:GT2 family glycosyltransferase